MNRRLIVAVGILVLILVLVALAVRVRTTPTQPDVGPTPSPTTTTASTPNQSTLVVAVRDESSLITDAVVHGAIAKPDALPLGSWLSLQPGLAIAVNEKGSVSLSQRGPFSPVDVSAELSNELGFDVDGAFILDRLAFAALVDSVGGVTVNSPTPVVAVDADGATTVLVKGGKQKLFGPAAAQYVIALGPNEEQATRMARFDDVWTQVLLKLPGNVDRVRGIVVSLGSLSRLSLSPEDIAESLLDAQTSLTARTMTSGIPSTVKAGVGSTAIYTVLPAPTQQTVVDLFAPSVLVPGTGGAVPRVRVFAAGATFESIDDVSVAFTSEDLSLVWGGHTVPVAATEILIPDEAQRALGEKVAKTLGLPVSAIRVDATQAAGVQAAVKLAADVTVNSEPATPSASAVAP